MPARASPSGVDKLCYPLWTTLKSLEDKLVIPLVDDLEVPCG